MTRCARLLALCCTLLLPAGTALASEGTKTGGLPTIGEKTRDMQRLAGVLTLHLDPEALKLYVEVPAARSDGGEVGRYILGAGGQTADVGKYIVIWKNDGGTWKLHRDIFNSDQAAE